MPSACVTHLLAAVGVATAFALSGPDTRAQEADIQTIYATEKGACGSGARSRVEITEGRIAGPGFDCALSAGRPAGSGLVTYEATCTVDGKKTSRGLTLDLGNYDDHYELSLPERKDWLALYPCTPVPGLKSR